MLRSAMLRRAARGYVGALASAMVLLSWSTAAWACPVCFSAKNEENQIAYIATTGFLTFLPLLMIGGLVLWVRHKVRELHELSGEPGDE